MDALQKLGIPDDTILRVLEKLRLDKNYTSLGEVDKALDMIHNEHREAEEAELRRIRQVEYIAQQE